MEYVSDAHSWYKFIVRRPSTITFYVFLHPKVPQWGHLDYRWGEPQDPTQGLVLHRPGERDYELQGEGAVARPVYYKVPEEVLRAGQVTVTGFIHRYAYKTLVITRTTGTETPFHSLSLEELEVRCENERLQQQALLAAAVDRMLAVVYES